MGIEAGLSFQANDAAANVPLDITSHMWPKEMIREHIQCLFDTKMASESTGMCFLQKNLTNRTSWNAYFVSPKQEAIMHIVFIPTFSIIATRERFFKISINIIKCFNGFQAKYFCI